MTQDEVIKLAKEAGFGNYAYEAAGIFERFAAMVAAAEREKCTGTQEFVTLPREVVELAIEAIGDAKHKIEFDAIDALIAALKQPPTTEDPSVVQQPQVEQEPVARVVGTGHLGGHFYWCKPDSQDYLPPGALLYTRPQPKREPLSDDDLCKVFPAIATYTEANKTLYRSIARAIEAAHNIK